jgi:hypothetical protein
MGPFLEMATIGGIEGAGRVTLTKGASGLPQFVGSMTVAVDQWRRAVELVHAGEPVQYAGPARTGDGTKDVTLNVLVTKVHNPSAAGARVDFVSTELPCEQRSDGRENPACCHSNSRSACSHQRGGFVS